MPGPGPAGTKREGGLTPLTVDLCHVEGITGISPRRLEAVFFSPVWEIDLFLCVLSFDVT